MPAKNKKPVFTYQTRVCTTREQEVALSRYAVLFGRVERALYADLQRGEDGPRGEGGARLKSEYLVRWGITARQFNAVRIQLQGKIDSLRALLPRQIDDLRTKIRQAKRTIAKLEQRIPGSNQLHQKRRRLARLELGFEQLEADRKAGRIRICFGSKKLFHAQFHLRENGFASHAEWKQAWTEGRSNQFFILGSKDETAGCQSCVASPSEDGSYALRLRLPNAIGKYVVLTGVRFAYGQERLEESLACGRAISYRFLRDSKGWRVFVSSAATPVERITDKGLGAIGIDINPDQLVVAELDGFGNFIGGQHLPCVTYGKTREQAKAILGDSVKKAIEVAVESHKPIVIERLEFGKKKAALENEGTGRARMLSSFAYQQTIRYLKAAGFRAGVEVIEVNPAYTSTLGTVNYAVRCGISIHQGAAIAIARRGLSLSERPAARVARLPTRQGGHVTLPLPARNRSKHVWSFWSQVSRQIRAALAAPVRLLPETAGSTPVSLCFQTPRAT